MVKFNYYTVAMFYVGDRLVYQISTNHLAQAFKSSKH